MTRVGSGRGSDALAAARAAARARREAARQLADQARDGTPEPEPDLEPEPPQPPPVPDAVTRADRDGDRPRWPDRALDPARPFDPAELRHRRPREQHVGHGALRAGSPTARPKARPAARPSARRATDRTGAPAWYPPLVGAWAAAFVVVPTLDEAAARLAGAGVLVLVLVGFFATFRAPGQPAPTATTASAYAAAVVACAVAAWFVAREVHPGAGAALALVLMTGLVAAYERRA